MPNLSAINHINFARLHELTNNYNKAILLDKLIFWWQISTYTLDDGKIWFTRCLNQISEESKISKRSVERYLQEFEASGIIEKTNKLYKKKNLYIRITEKLLIMLGEPIKSSEQPNKSTINQQKSQPKSLFLKQVGDTNPANLAVSIYKDQDSNSLTNSTVRQPSIVDNSKINPQKPQNSSYPTYPIEKEIGERVTERFKNYIKGTMRNLQTQHNLSFSKPDQLFAEIVFSVLHVQNQFPGVSNAHHRVNLIAKLLRQKQWRTPKGFYNHWDIGQSYKLKLEKQEKEQQALKQNEYDIQDKLLNVSNTYNKQRLNNFSPSVNKYQIQEKLKPLKSEYSEILSLIAIEAANLNVMKKQHLKIPKIITIEVINNANNKLSKLYKKAEILLEQIEQHKEAA